MAALMDEATYREVLPTAYMVAAMERERKAPTPFAVGMCARRIAECADERSPAYRIALATAIPCTILDVKMMTTSFGAEYFLVTFQPLAKDSKVQDIRTPLLNDFRLGRMTRGI